MDALITIVQGDYGYDLNFTLKDSAGVTVDLTGAVLTFSAQSNSDGAVYFSNPMDVLSTSSGTCKYTVQQNDFLVAGSFSGEIQLNFSAGTEIVSFSGIKIEVVSKLPVS